MTVFLPLVLVVTVAPAASLGDPKGVVGPQAEIGEPEPAEFNMRLRPGLLPALFSLVPGVVLHGSGVFAIGDSKTAYKLVTAEGVGLVSMFGAAYFLGETGATRRFVALPASVLMLGTGLFLTSFMADMFGAITGGTDAAAARNMPGVSLFLGYRYVHDVQFQYRNLTRLEVQLGLSRWILGGKGWVALDDNNQRARLEAAYRPIGPAPGKPNAIDGSYLSLGAAGTYHGYETQGFRTLSVEALISGRYDLRRLGPSLSGSFVEAELGWGMEFYDYDLEGVEFGEDMSDMLLGGFGWGFYLGRAPASHGEVMVYYDHRRDDYTGGIVGGFGGHFGLTGSWTFCPDQNGGAWGIRAEAEIGSAFYGGVDLLYQWGVK